MTDRTAASRLHPRRAQEWARRRRTTRLALRLGVLAVGAALVVAGVAMLVLPGPGWAVVILGLVVLASEFAWAQRLLDPVRRIADRGVSAIRSRRHGRAILTGLVAAGIASLVAGVAVGVATVT